MTEKESLLAPTFLFRFASNLQHHQALWTNGRCAAFNEGYRLPSFGELEGKPLFADVRGAWNKTGLAFSVRVQGKKSPPWCRATRADDSDGLQLFIDTRDTKTIHRASRFCHRFVILPFGSGRAMDQPSAELAPVNRAREAPKPVSSGTVRVASEKRIDGYVLETFIPSSALTGFDPDEHRRIGFTYAVIDRELGWQTYSMGPEFPFTEDPSLWATLELCDA